MMLQRIFFLFLIGTFLFPLEIYAQESSIFPREEYYKSTQTERTFSGVHWLEVIEGIDYSESVRTERTEDENFFTDGSNSNKNRRIYDEDNRQNSSSEFWATVLKFLIIAIGIGIIGVIISRFLGPGGLNKPRSRRVAESNLEVSLENIEEKIHESDLDQFLQQALEENNYNLAIRLFYLTTIKELSLAKAIRWKRDKTNRDYIREIEGQSYANDFKQLTSIFERVWYGTYLLNREDFNLLKPKFNQLINTIKEQALAQATSSIE